ncbi:hypothetical protein [Pedobacter sp.]|uniref:hypothetical protein n=1 Tax=Pedobacter sp. TaxID=1411316 RepID=UPI003BAB3A19
MENRDKIQQQEDIVNPEQFQVGRSSEEEKDIEKSETTQTEDSGYTAQETEFADGKDTELNEALGNESKTDDSNETNQEADGTFENKDSGKDKGQQPEVNDI